MKKLALVLAAVCAAYALQAASIWPLEPQGVAPASSVAAWEQRARGITIVRDTWGIPHVYGKTDADAVFGVMYARPRTTSTASRRTTSMPWDGWPRPRASRPSIATCG